MHSTCTHLTIHVSFFCSHLPAKEDEQCNAGSLAVCAGAIIGGAAPSASCCSNLRAQQGCFCQFARNPAYSGYINSANARKTLSSCRVTVPRC
ncbi:hypothetical protein ABZP36_012455 [Zizania latifolia]